MSAYQLLMAVSWLTFTFLVLFTPMDLAAVVFKRLIYVDSSHNELFNVIKAPADSWYAGISW